MRGAAGRFVGHRVQLPAQVQRRPCVRHRTGHRGDHAHDRRHRDHDVQQARHDGSLRRYFFTSPVAAPCSFTSTFSSRLL